MKINQVVTESQMTCSECGGPAFSDLLLAEKQDACYNKVRSRYKVWPSAYASGALVQCRKKGAANWGNKTKNEGLGGDLNEFAPPGSGDDDGGFDENTLKRLAAQWWHGDEDPRVEKTLAAAGWEIGQDEGYDNGGVFVVRAGDENGNTYTSWPAEELEGLAEGQSPKKELERLKLRQNAEHGRAPLQRQAATQARIRELEKQVKDEKPGVTESYPKHQDLSGISTEKLKAYLAKQAKQSVPGEGAQVKRVKAELQRREQSMKESNSWDRLSGDTSNLDPEHLAYLKQQSEISRRTGLAVGDRVTLKDKPGFEGEIVHDWGGGDYTISGGGGGMKQSNNHRANARIIQKIKDRQWSNKDMERLRVATRDFDDILSADGPDRTKQSQIKNRIKTRPMAGPKGVLPEQGVAEGMLDNPDQPDSPVAQAIIRRILMQRTDLLAKYGPGYVGQAVDDVADSVGDWDEIGSSDVSGWVRQVEHNLKNKLNQYDEPMDEDYNPEYDDEAGMADNNLKTLQRAVEGIDDLIQSGDNLPEWCQEKIAVAKSMLVAVWDYMYSEEASDEVDPEIDAMYEAMDQLAEEIAAREKISADLVWESFEALDDHMLYETAAWRRKEGKSKSGGLNRKGVASYRRENPGSKLQMAVTTKPSKLKPGSKAAKRRKSFCARMSGVKGPMKKPNGKPTRKALALRKWNC